MRLIWRLNMKREGNLTLSHQREWSTHERMKTICELINKSDNFMWGLATTQITVNQISRMLLGELFTSRIGVFSFNRHFLWLLRIYFHQLNYLQLTDKRPPHVSFFFIASHRLLQFQPENLWMNSRLPLCHRMLISSVENVSCAYIVDDINFFIQQWNDFFTFLPAWWWI